MEYFCIANQEYQTNELLKLCLINMTHLSVKRIIVLLTALRYYHLSENVSLYLPARKAKTTLQENKTLQAIIYTYVLCSCENEY